MKEKSKLYTPREKQQENMKAEQLHRLEALKAQRDALKDAGKRK